MVSAMTVELVVLTEKERKSRGCYGGRWAERC
jgi:hypothetical protein